MFSLFNQKAKQKKKLTDPFNNTSEVDARMSPAVTLYSAPPPHQNTLIRAAAIG